MTTIDDDSLAQHPHLKHFLESSPPDASLLSSDGCDGVYAGLKFSDPLITDGLTLFEVLSICGKISHIEALPLSPLSKKETVRARGYQAIEYAARNGDLTTLKYLETYLTDLEIQAAVKALDYQAIQSAVKNGHLSILRHLETHLTNDEKNDAVRARHYKIIQLAAQHGRLTTLQHLETHLTDAEKREAVRAWDYLAFQYAALNGHLTTLQHLETHLTDAEKKAAVMVRDYQAIRFAALNGHLSTLQHLETYLTDDEKRAAVMSCRYQAFKYAAQNGHLSTLRHLERYLTDAEKKEALMDWHYQVIVFVIQNGHLTTLQHLETYLTDAEKKLLAKRWCYQAIQFAVKNDYFPTLQHLESNLTAAQKIAGVRILDYRAIRLAAENGHLLILRHLEMHLTDAEKKAAVMARNYEAFESAVKNGHLSTLHHLETHLTADEKKAAVKANEYQAIQSAAEKGDLTILRHLETHLTPDEKIEAVKARNYQAFQFASKNADLTTLQHLETHLTPDEKIAAVKANNYLAIRLAAENGRLLTLRYLETRLTDAEKKAAVKAHHYLAIEYAAEKGQITTLRYLETHLTADEKKVAVKDSEAIQLAAQHGHLTTLQHLETHLSADEKKEVLRASEYKLITEAATQHHVAIVHHFLRQPQALNFIEKHDHEYGDEFTYSFVDGVINELKANKAGFEAAQPNAVFNMDDEQATLCFYLLRNLIRRGVREDDRAMERFEEDMLFLLSIPAVRALCHQAVTVDEGSPGEENELLRFAIHNGNDEAAAILMRLPDVYRLAQANNYYQNETRGDMDLRRMAEDRESSMVGLSKSERRLLKGVKTHYHPSLQEKGGINAVMVEFKDWLKAQYEASPATISLPLTGADTAEKIPLPFEWDALEGLRAVLTPEQYQDALKAYYAHDAHTAYRYLSKPNRWMHPGASYVYINPDSPQERWATFEDYSNIIALFYLAAFDEDTPALDDYTLESRKELFVKELALIGRAHNWDRSNEHGRQYDDKEADKPSCFSGVMRRLWQSVLGHWMFQRLNDTAIEQELVAFTHNHFKELITPENMDAVYDAFHRVIGYEPYETNDGGATNAPTPASDFKLLSSLNINDEILETFRNSLNEKYAGQLITNDKFSAQFNSFFELKDSNQRLHVMLSFNGECIAYLILMALKTAAEASKAIKVVNPNREGLFGSSSTSNIGAPPEEPHAPDGPSAKK